MQHCKLGVCYKKVHVSQQAMLICTIYSLEKKVSTANVVAKSFRRNITILFVRRAEITNLKPLQLSGEFMGRKEERI